MSKTANAGFLTYLQGTSLSLAECLKIKRRDGLIHAITTHNRPLSINLADGDGALTYSAALGFSRSSLPLTNELEPEEVEVTAPFGGNLSEADLRAGKLDRARFLLFVVRWDNPVLNNTMKLFSGVVQRVEPQGALYKATLRGLKELLAKKQIVETWSPMCRADLGDTRCTVSFAGLTQNGTITSVTNRRTFLASAFPSPSPSDKWNEGKIQFTSGALSGVTLELRSYTHSTRTFVLKDPAEIDIPSGTTFIAFPGCDKRFATCRDKFSNAENFRGEPHVPEERKVAMARPLVAPGGGYSGTGSA